MPQRVPTPVSYWIIRNKKDSIRNLAQTTLVKFSIEYLQQIKLVTKNFKSGLCFFDSYTISKDTHKMLSIAVKYCMSLLPSTKEEFDASSQGTYKYPFLRVEGGRISITTTRDPSVIKLVEKYNEYLISRRFNFTIVDAAVYNYEYRMNGTPLPSSEIGDDGFLTPFRFVIIGSGFNESLAVHTYKFLYDLPKMINILKVLHRKAVFNDPEIRKQNRSCFFQRFLQPIIRITR